MKRNCCWLLVLAGTLALGACATEEELAARRTGPVSPNSQMSWSQPVPGQGGGQLGMLPQNQTRR